MCPPVSLTGRSAQGRHACHNLLTLSSAWCALGRRAQGTGTRSSSEKPRFDEPGSLDGMAKTRDRTTKTSQRWVDRPVQANLRLDGSHAYAPGHKARCSRREWCPRDATPVSALRWKSAGSESQRRFTHGSGEIRSKGQTRIS